MCYAFLATVVNETFQWSLSDFQERHCVVFSIINKICICIYIYTYIYIQDVSRLEDITAAGDFLGLSDQKFHINMCPILDGYGVMGIF